MGMSVPKLIAEWGPTISLLVLACQLLIAWGLWSLRKQFVSQAHCDKRCKEDDASKQAMEKRQTELETAQRAMPTGKDVSAITERLGGIEGDMKAMLATMQGQAQVMNRIERPLNLLMEHHLKGK